MKRNPRSMPNITRFDKKTTAFEGWRVCKCIKGVTFTKYFPDNKKKSKAKSPSAASLSKAKADLRMLKRVYDNGSMSALKKWAKAEGFTLTGDGV